jgi:hypothetical protein
MKYIFVFEKNRRDLTQHINHNLSFYQNDCRIYLDEYEVEEVDLRVNFDTSLLMKRFLKRD